MTSYITILFSDGAGLHLASIYLRLEGFLTKTPAPFPITHEPRKLDHALPGSDHALLFPLLQYFLLREYVPFYPPYPQSFMYQKEEILLHVLAREWAHTCAHSDITARWLQYRNGEHLSEIHRILRCRELSRLF